MSKVCPKVSIVIPVYNAEKYLYKCINSLLNQKFSDFEIICVDDGSTDNSLKILEEFKALDERIIIIHQKNCFAGSARNKGIQIARGEYLSILDADDFYEQNMLELAYYNAKKHNAEVVVFPCDLYMEETDTFVPANWTIKQYLFPDTNPFAGTDVKKEVFKVFVGWSWDKLFKTEFVKNNQLMFQEGIRTSNDLKFVFSAICKAKRIFVLDSLPLVHHRKNAVSISVTREQSWDCFYKSLCALREQLKNWELYERFEQDFVNYSLHFILWNLNSIKEPYYTKLYNKLQNEWLTDLGLNTHSKKYFYHEREYQSLLNLRNCSPQNFFMAEQKVDEKEKRKSGRKGFRKIVKVIKSGFYKCFNQSNKKLAV